MDNDLHKVYMKNFIAYQILSNLNNNITIKETYKHAVKI